MTLRCGAAMLLLLAGCGPGAEVKSGRELYLAYGCAACHGVNGDGNGPAAALSGVKPRDLRDLSSFRGPKTAEGIASLIAFGIADGRTGMPAYPDLPKQERLAIAEYILSIAEERPAGGTVNVAEAWVRAPHPAQRIAAAYMRIANPGPAVSLVEVTSPAARVVEMHETSTRDGVMSMRKVDRIDIPGRGAVSLEPNGGHLMLIDVEQPLPAMVPLALKFNDGTSTLVLAPVREPDVD